MSREPGDAPGLEWKKRPKDGARIPRWRARKKAVALGYRPSVIQFDIDPNDHAAIAERCRAEWAKMEAWLANERPAPMFDGTLASLIDLYSGDEESPYHDLRYRTQRSYDQQLKLLKTSVGARRIDKLNGEDFRRWYRKFREPKSPGLPPRIGRAHYGITLLRILFGYGQTRGLPNCDKLKGILREMRFKDTPPRNTVMTYEEVIAFIAKAHELGRSELALAQALQFEGTPRQIDVIGEWLPDPERRSGTRWANGLLWQHIRDYVLVKDTTKTGQEAGIDFKLYPLAFGGATTRATGSAGRAGDQKQPHRAPIQGAQVPKKLARSGARGRHTRQYHEPRQSSRRGHRGLRCRRRPGASAPPCLAFVGYHYGAIQPENIDQNARCRPLAGGPSRAEQ